MLTNQTTWTEKYRPKTIDELIFPDNNKWKTYFNQCIEEGKLSGNLCLYGFGGLGKTTLSEILVRSIIKNPADFKKIQTRSVEEIEQLASFMPSKPISSKQKLLIIDEADCLSKQAQKELKEKYTEKYVDNCPIILITNYINKIDPFLLQRFSAKICFDQLEPDAVSNRLKFILEKEGAKFKEENLRDYVSLNIYKGVRTLINDLQINYQLNNKLIIFDDIDENKTVTHQVTELTLNIIKSLLGCNDIKIRRSSLIDPNDSKIIGLDWCNLVQMTHNNYSINYNKVLYDLNETMRYIPIRIILIKYLESIENKKYPNLHFIACLSEIMKCIADTNL